MNAVAIYTRQPDTDDCELLLELIGKHTDRVKTAIHSYEEVFLGQTPAETDAVFAYVRDMRSLEGVRKLSRHGIPTVIVSQSPDFAMEGIRLGVCHYLIEPLAEPELITALTRLGLYAEPGAERRCANENTDP